jgi:hypothetical protein
MVDELFKLPVGFIGWCHICAEEPFKKETVVKVNTGPREMEEIGLERPTKTKTLPGVGFKTLEEMTVHKKKVHPVWRIR